MNPKKPTTAPARRKPPPSSNAPDQLSPAEARKLNKAGQRDGHHALPKQDENGIWTSPLLQKEVDAYDEFCVFTWGALQEKHEPTHREIDRLCQEIRRTEENLVTLRRNAPPPPDLTERQSGEEQLSEKLIRTRRQREYEHEHAAYFSKVNHAEATLEQACRRLSELYSTVQSAEKTTSLLCERAASTVQKRITAYWQGALKTHPYYDQIPPNPEVTFESNAETEYFHQNQQVKAEAARILARGQFAPAAHQRTEVHYVSKKKTSRR
ncbi:MAG: hypothetical protein LBJ11_05585 [Oscillospiraceae bacterium]|jgi:hypothetical protein|nr:hypothetical protein [Oscillospiraceae bacterium]